MFKFRSKVLTGTGAGTKMLFRHRNSGRSMFRVKVMAQSQDFKKIPPIDPFLDVKNIFFDVRFEIFPTNSCFFFILPRFLQIFLMTFFTHFVLKFYL